MFKCWLPLLACIAVFGAGCSDSKSPTGVPSPNTESASDCAPNGNKCCSADGTELSAECCSNGTTPTLRLGSENIGNPNCPGAPANPQSAIQAAAQAGSSAQQNLNTAAKLHGEKNDLIQSNDPLAQSQKATEGIGGIIRATPTPSAKDSSPGISGIPSGSGLGGGGNSAGAIGSKTDSAALSGLTTSPIPGSSTSPSGAASALATSGTLSGGGSGAGFSGGSGNSHGNQVRGIEGGAGEMADYSKGGSNAAEAHVLGALGAEDPDDYFTRIGIQDNLFKKVEIRYMRTATGWAQAKAQETTDQVDQKKRGLKK